MLEDICIHTVVNFLPHLNSVSTITCSTVVLQCYRRQVISMEQGKIRLSVTLYFLDRSLPNLV